MLYDLEIKEEEKKYCKKVIKYCDIIIEIDSNHYDAFNLKGISYARIMNTKSFKML